MLLNSILRINKKYYLPCWLLYMDLIETKDNPENFNFYEWESLNNHPNINQINIYKRNMEKNIEIIINLIEECIIDITNEYEMYNIDINDEITIDLGLIKCTYCYSLIDAYGYCKCD